MRKIVFTVFSILLSILFLGNPSSVFAQPNTYSCVWDNDLGVCATAAIDSCDSANGYSAGDGCTNPPVSGSGDCTSRHPACVAPKYKCVGTVCQLCAPAEVCTYTTASSCQAACAKYKCDPVQGCIPDPAGVPLAQCSASCSVGAPPPIPGGPAPNVNPTCNGNAGIDTAIGCIPFDQITNFTGFFLRWGLGIAGGVALLLLVFSIYQITTSTGDPRKLQAGRELFTSAIAGLIILIFSVFLLRIIGVNILGIL